MVVAGCVGLAGASLLFRAAPTEDVWNWAIWGREVAHLRLDTVGGSSWKPLPVVFTTVFAPFGASAPYLWLATARLGGLAALVMAYRLAARLGGGRVGGLVAAVGLALSAYWFRYLASGVSEPLIVAFVLLAAERHLAGQRGIALAAGFAAALGRPEVWVFFGGYAAWLVVRDRRLRWWAVAAVVGVAVLWIGGAWWGSGQPFGGTDARSRVLGDQLGAVIGRAGEITAWPVELAATGAIAIGVWRRDWRLLFLAGMAAAWVGVVVAMNEIGYAGLRRFMLAPAAIACVLAGVAAGALIARARTRVRLVAALALVVGLVWLSLPTPTVSDQLSDAMVRDDLQDDLGAAVTAAGGPKQLTACGQFAVNSVTHNALAWRLHVPPRRVRFNHLRPPAVLFRTAARRDVAPHAPPPVPIGVRAALLARTHGWDVVAIAPMRGPESPCFRAAERLNLAAVT